MSLGCAHDLKHPKASLHEFEFHGTNVIGAPKGSQLTWVRFVIKHSAFLVYILHILVSICALSNPGKRGGLWTLDHKKRHVVFVQDVDHVSGVKEDDRHLREILLGWMRHFRQRLASQRRLLCCNG